MGQNKLLVNLVGGGGTFILLFFNFPLYLKFLSTKYILEDTTAGPHLTSRQYSGGASFDNTIVNKDKGHLNI